MGVWLQDSALEGRSSLKKGQGPHGGGRLLPVALDCMMTLGVWLPFHPGPPQSSYRTRQQRD